VGVRLLVVGVVGLEEEWMDARVGRRMVGSGKGRGARMGCIRRKTGETVTGRPAERERTGKEERERESGLDGILIETNERRREGREGFDELGAGCRGVPSCCLMSS